MSNILTVNVTNKWWENKLFIFLTVNRVKKNSSQVNQQVNKK